MKTTILLGLMCAGLSHAAFEKWTHKDGRTVELELVAVTDDGDGKAGEFKLRSGRSVNLKSSELSDGDAAKMEVWEPPAPVVVGEEPSVFDKVLDGNLLKLSGKSLKRFALTERPKKYYVFYYTASWCAPCHRFTPSLVDFYNKHKNDRFEIVLITSDDNEEAMEKYAAEMKMPWPQLKLKKVDRFKKEFEHGTAGIPSLIVCELDGTKLGNCRSLRQLEKLVK